MRSILIFFLLFTTTLAYAEIYKWVDKNGQTHYSDTQGQHKTAVKFKANTDNNVLAPAAAESDPNPADKSDAKKKITYQLQITSPEQEETILDNNGNLTIIATIKPNLNAGDVLVLLMDDKITGGTQSSSIFNLTNIDRGEHSFVIKAVAPNGKQLASSAPRTIYLHRTTLYSGTDGINNPQRTLPKAKMLVRPKTNN